MKPSFALNFSHDGLELLHRQGSDWRAVGEVSLADPDLTEVVTRLRRSALALEPKGILSKLIIPASQILYTEVRAPGPDAASRRTQIAEALEGRTPYDVSDLVFDWFGRGEVVQVAVVARETLAEAEAFADLYGFCPVSFVASPEPGQFAAEPFFGLTSTAAQHLPEGARLDRDQDPVRVLAASAAVEAEPDATAAGWISEPDTADPAGADAAAEWSEDAEAESPLEPVETEFAAEADDLPPFVETVAEPVLTQAEETPKADLEDEAAAMAELAEEVATESSGRAPSADLADNDLPWESDFEGAEARDFAEPLDARSDAEFAGAPADLAPVAPLQDATGFDLDAVDTAHAAPEPEFERGATADLVPATEPEPYRSEVTTDSDLPPEFEIAPEFEPARPIQTDDLPPPAFLAPEEPPEAPFADLTQEEDPEAAVGLPLLIDPAAEETRPTFASIRSAAGQAPKVGAATTEPAAPRKLGGAGLPRVLDPGIDLPGPDVAAVARSLAGAKDRARTPAPPAGRKPLAAAGRKPVQAKPLAPQEPAAAADRTVFGARRLEPLPARPRHLWLVLTLALVLFMLVVAIWSSFLDDPPEVAAPDTAPAEVVEATPPPADPQPEAAPQPAEPAPQQTEPEQAAVPPADPSAVWGERAPPDAGLSLAAVSTSDPQAVQDRAARPGPAAPAADPQPAPLPLPAPFAQLARLGPGGEITPTEAGVAMPGGFTLFAGRPPVVSQPRPEGLVVEAPTTEAAAAPEAAAPESDPAPYADPALSGFKPRARPADLAPVEEDGAALAPLTPPADPTLANRKPRGRPDSIAKAAADAAATRLAEEQAAAAAQAAIASASAQAVAESRRPTTRPQDLAPSPVASAAVEAAVAAAVSAQAPPARVAAAAPAPEPERAAADPEEVEQDEPEPTSAMPKLPTSASVAKQATQANALNLGKINLIGLYGAADNRRALVRMPNGKFVKVGVGDRLDGGRVTAIGSGKLTYQKSGRSVTLELLKGG